MDGKFNIFSLLVKINTWIIGVVEEWNDEMTLACWALAIAWEN